MQNQHRNPNQMPRETWEAVKRGLGIEINAEEIQRDTNAAQRVHAREEETPETSILRTYNNGVNLFDALRIADDAGRKMLSHPQWRRIIDDPELFEEYKPALPAWSSTGIAYAVAGEELGERIEFNGLAVEIPKEHQKSKDIALIFPNLKVEQDSNGLYHVKPAEIEVIGKFPKEDDWYIPDSKYAIPQGRKSAESNSSALYLYRRDDEPYVGAVAPSFDHDGRGVVVVYDRPRGGSLGVAVGGAAATP